MQTELLARTGLTLPQLVEAGRVFSQDYRPLTDYIYASPGAWLAKSGCRPVQLRVCLIAAT